jgi:hypothetical protein
MGTKFKKERVACILNIVPVRSSENLMFTCKATRRRTPKEHPLQINDLRRIICDCDWIQLYEVLESDSGADDQEEPAPIDRFQQTAVFMNSYGSDRVWVGALVNMVMNLWIPYKLGSLLTC